MTDPANPQATPPLLSAQALDSNTKDVWPVLLALDFDGTLATIVNDPSEATLLPAAKAALARLTGTMTVAVISGRSLDELTTRFAGIEHLLLIGEHGRAWRHDDGTITTMSDTRTHADSLPAIHDALLAVLGGAAGWTIEPKVAGIAVHHRNATVDEVQRLRPAVLNLLHAAGTTGTQFRVIHGHAVDELLPDSVSKGAALATLCADHPGLTPLAIGDDVTDEDAFVIARQHGGHGILVATTPRVSAASFRLAEPVDVATFLTLLAARSS